MEKYIFIQSRMSSSRLPGKSLMEIEGKKILDLVIDRSAHGNFFQIVLTSDDPTDDRIEETCNSRAVACFRGSLSNVLDRFYQCGLKYGLDDSDLIVRLTADNILPDGAFIDELVQFHIDTGNLYTSPSFPSSGLPYGIYAEVFSFHSLRLSKIHANSSYQKEHVTPYIKDFLADNDQAITFDWLVDDFSGVRCTIDTQDDYMFMKELLSFHGCEKRWFEYFL